MSYSLLYCELSACERPRGFGRLGAGTPPCLLTRCPLLAAALLRGIKRDAEAKAKRERAELRGAATERRALSGQTKPTESRLAAEHTKHRCVNFTCDDIAVCTCLAARMASAQGRKEFSRR